MTSKFWSTKITLVLPPLKNIAKHFMYLRSLLLVLFLSLGLSCFAQKHPPKREFRGVWIATVGNIDWPLKKGLPTATQKQEFIDYLNFFHSLGFNAVVVQIRAAADAFYPSPYEPWSRYLTGKQGQAPSPYYDPLAFMIKETHKRNMEFHAWFNPFRALVNNRHNPNPPQHVTRLHPEWLINYGSKTYFDPGNPKARKYILSVFKYVVRHYDIDAVHIDDYFYPYYVRGRVFRDNISYIKYGEGMDKADWRRSNVNTFIFNLHRLIKQTKPWVQFGVSPFGIYRNKTQDSIIGSDTHGQSCYDNLYSDILHWEKYNWVDYVAPQLYWARSSHAASYSVLLPWWVFHNGRNLLYIGLGVYRMVNARRSSPWYGTHEILTQIRMARRAHVDGFIFYSASSFRKISPAFADSLREHYFSTIALPPTMPWIDSVPPPAPIFKHKQQTQNGLLLKWTDKKAGQEQLKYVVYRFKRHEKMDLNNPEHIIALTKATQFTDRDYHRKKSYYYVITAIDRLWNESRPSQIIMVE